MMNKVRAKSPANVNRSATKTEEAPVVPTKTEETTIPTVEEPTVAAPTTTEAATLDEPVGESAATTATTPKEGRRKSYFGGSGNKISSIFRKPSQAVRGNKEAKKENVTPAAEETTTATEAPVVASEVPSTAESKVEEHKPVDAATEASTVGREHQSSPAVPAAA